MVLTLEYIYRRSRIRTVSSGIIILILAQFRYFHYDICVTSYFITLYYRLTFTE